jgi:methyl-accepting chemotaxis protein
MPHWLFRRRNYLINKDFQVRYIVRNLFALLVMALIISFTVYYTTWARIMDEFYDIPKIAAQFAPLFASVNHTMILILILFMILAAVVSVFVSHSMAGPIYRFEKTLQALSQGDFTLKVGLRKTDEFKDLAQTMNDMIAELRDSLVADAGLIKEVVAISEHLSAASEKRQGGKKSAATVKDMEKLNQILTRLQENIAKFKLEK